MRKKKLHFTLISIIAALTIVSAVFISLTSSQVRALDIANEPMGYYVLSVNPKIEISVDSAGNVLEVSAQNDDARPIIDGQNFTGISIRETIFDLLDLIYDAGYLQKSGMYNVIDLSYFSDTTQKSESEIISLIPDKYLSSSEVVVHFGKASQRKNLYSSSVPPSAVPTTFSPSNTTYTMTPEISITPEPSTTKATVEKEEISSKKADKNSDEGATNKHFTLTVKIVGSNAVFNWSKYKFDSVNVFDHGVLYYIHKIKGSGDGTRKTLKTFPSSGTLSATISLSSLGMKSGDELFFTYSAELKSRASAVTNNVSIKKMEDGSYKIYNDNPSPFGHGEVGVDYFAPSMTIGEADGTLCIKWSHPDPDHEDFIGVIIYASESSAVPKYPDGGNANYFVLGPSRRVYYLELLDFYNLQPGKTYYFSAFSLYTSGNRLLGNTIRATIPEKKDTAFVNVHLNNLMGHINIYWTDAAGDNVASYEYIVEYKDKYSEDRVFMKSGTNSFGHANAYSGKFETGCAVELVPERTYYVSLYTIYKDRSRKFGNEAAVIVPGKAEPPTATPPAIQPSESPSATPTEQPTQLETPSDTSTENPTQQPTPAETAAEIHTDQPTQQETPTDTSLAAPETPFADGATQETTQSPTVTPSTDQTLEPTETKLED